MINICNLNTYNKRLEWKNQFLICRPHPLGNPYPMSSEKDRTRVILQYEDYFNKQMDSGEGHIYDEVQKIVKALKQYGTVDLICWCAPKQCHGEIIMDWILGNT